MYNFEPPATNDEIEAAALQYVRKISGFQKPSQQNSVAFESALKDVTEASRKLLDNLVTNAPSKNREEEAQKARERNRIRFGTN